jgi:hypothetical protein
LLSLSTRWLVVWLWLVIDIILTGLISSSLSD